MIMNMKKVCGGSNMDDYYLTGLVFYTVAGLNYFHVNAHVILHTVEANEEIDDSLAPAFENSK